MKKLYLLILLHLLPVILYSGTVYITPAVFGFTDEMSFGSAGHDGCNLAMIGLRNEIIKRGHNCTFLTQKNSNQLDKDCWFFVLDVPRDEKIQKIITSHPKERSILIIGEPPSVSPLSYDVKRHTDYKQAFTYFNELADNAFYFLFYYPQPFLNVIKDVVPFSEKKFCTMIIGEHTSSHPDELYSARRATLSFYENNHPHKFDFYGWGWNSRGHPCYRGTVDNKLSYLRKYKFAFCYENMKSSTYVTEKIFDALHAGCVPVYWGAQEITNLIPCKAYILKEDFKTEEELYTYLNAMTEDEYQTYLDAAQEFFKSQFAYKYSIESFVNIMISALFS